MKFKDALKEFSEIQADAEEVVNEIGNPKRNIDEDIKIIRDYLEYLDGEIKFIS